MELQYISDNQGHPTAVIVPIEEWMKITNNKMELPEQKLAKRKASEFRGIFSKEEGERFNNYLTKARSEWERNF